jgi:hypothetical protein
MTDLQKADAKPGQKAPVSIAFERPEFDAFPGKTLPQMKILANQKNLEIAWLRAALAEIERGDSPFSAQAIAHYALTRYS